MSALSQQLGASSHRRPIRVMVVDDSAVIRGFIVRNLESDPDIEVVATCSNGRTAILQLPRCAPDVVILDIEMPVMDGLTALPKMLAVDGDIKVVIASTLSQRNAEISLKALALGAADYIPKPRASDLGASDSFHQELLRKVSSLGRCRSLAGGAGKRPQTSSGAIAAPCEKLRLRQPKTDTPRVLAIGSSTGGPQALLKVLSSLPASFTAPILIAQHMPATFTPVLAQHLSKAARRPCMEAADGDPVRSGHIHLAPGDFHLELAVSAAQVRLHLTKAPPENYCRPSVNPLLRSAVAAYGAHVTGLVLTGMGRDGLEGGRAIAAAGGHLVAQDEATSVVWGMPGAVALAGLCTAVLPLDGVAPHISRLFEGVRA